MSPGFIAATALLGDRADAIFGESDRPLDDARDCGGDRLAAIPSDRGPFGRPKCDSRMTLPPLSAISVMVGAIALDARGVGDLAVLHRHVEVDAHEHAFAFHVGVVEGAEGAHGRVESAIALVQASLPIATAVSTMRLEKPHSLSYHDITRTSVPSITLVWSMWKIDECGSWLKSLETLGASV